VWRVNGASRLEVMNLVVKPFWVSGVFLMLGAEVNSEGNKGALLNADVKKPLG